MAWIGPWPEGSFADGVRAGLDRTARYDLVDAGLDWVRVQIEPGYVERTPVRQVLEQPLEVARGLLDRERASERFTELFAEIVTVAAVARRVYRDADLTESDIESFLRDSSAIFNSFRHP